jgi:hypothetical protein
MLGPASQQLLEISRYAEIAGDAAAVGVKHSRSDIFRGRGLMRVLVHDPVPSKPILPAA